MGESLLAHRPDWLTHHAQQLDIAPETLRSLFVYSLALHDLGKFARSFQGPFPAPAGMNRAMPASRRTLVTDPRLRGDTSCLARDKPNPQRDNQERYLTKFHDVVIKRTKKARKTMPRLRAVYAHGGDRDTPTNRSPPLLTAEASVPGFTASRVPGLSVKRVRHSNKRTYHTAGHRSCDSSFTKVQSIEPRHVGTVAN